MKNCRRCLADKPLSDFRADPRYRDGFASWCRQCHRERNSSWAKENRERLSAKSAARRDSDREGARAINRRFKARHKDRLAKQHADWARRNRDKRNASAARHKAAKLRATPVWADHAEIAAIYKTAALLGKDFHVDHIVPLQGATVCGLHCEANLRIIPARLNEAKHARHWPDMFEDAQRQGDFFVEAA